MKQAISIKIPINFVGTPIGVQTGGGVLVTNLNELEISCLPSDIPDNIDVDISAVDLGASLQAGDINLDDKFELITPSDLSIVSVTQAAVEVEVVEEDSDDSTDSVDSTTEESDSEQSSENDNESEGDS